jgi:hypothetical protein
LTAQNKIAIAAILATFTITPIVNAILTKGLGCIWPNITTCQPTKIEIVPSPSEKISAQGVEGKYAESTKHSVDVDKNSGRKPSALVSAPSNLPKSIGWVRIGAVDNTSGEIFVGQQLIKTTQPVTISPSRVPQIGATVEVIHSVNVRVNAPKAPDYKLAQEKPALPKKQIIVIINTHSFVDSASSPLTAVWAEVGIKE